MLLLHIESSSYICDSLRHLHRRLPLRILNNIAHESSTQQYRRLVQVVVLVAQRSHAASLEDQTWVVRNVLTDPTSCERSQEVSVCDYQHIKGLLYATLGLADRVSVETAADVGDDGVAARGDLGWGSGGWMLALVED